MFRSFSDFAQLSLLSKIYYLKVLYLKSKNICVSISNFTAVCFIKRFSQNKNNVIDEVIWTNVTASHSRNQTLKP